MASNPNPFIPPPPSASSGGKKAFVMTAEEEKSLAEAMKKKDFRNLLNEYMKEISDPKSKAEHEAYLDQLEREGNLDQILQPGQQLLRPTPGFCIKCLITGSSGGSWDNPNRAYPASTVSNKSKQGPIPSNPRAMAKLFINICHSMQIEKATPQQQSKKGAAGGGDNWSIPFLLSPPRMDRDNKDEPVQVYDFVVNTVTYTSATLDVRIQRLIIETAMETVEKRTPHKLDKRCKVLKGATYKGSAPPPSVPFRPANGTAASPTAAGAGAKQPPPVPRPGTAAAPAPKAAPVPAPAAPPARGPAPAYRIVESTASTLLTDLPTGIDRTGDVAEMLLKRPTSLIVKINLPELAGMSGVDLDVTERQLTLTTPNDVYYLQIALPYSVDKEKSAAKFSKSTKQLDVTLAVLPMTAAQIDEWKTKRARIKAQLEEVKLKKAAAERERDAAAAATAAAAKKKADDEAAAIAAAAKAEADAKEQAAITAAALRAENEANAARAAAATAAVSANASPAASAADSGTPVVASGSGRPPAHNKGRRVSFSSEVQKLQFHPDNTNITTVDDKTHNREHHNEVAEQKKVKKLRLKNKASNVSFSWSENQSSVSVVVHVKNIRKDKVAIDAHERTLDVTFTTTSDAINYHLKLALHAPIVPDRIQSEVATTTLSLRLPKVQSGVMWHTLESTGPGSSASAASPHHPQSSPLASPASSPPATGLLNPPLEPALVTSASPRLRPAASLASPKFGAIPELSPDVMVSVEPLKLGPAVTGTKRLGAASDEKKVTPAAAAVAEAEDEGEDADDAAGEGEESAAAASTPTPVAVSAASPSGVPAPIPGDLTPSAPAGTKKKKKRAPNTKRKEKRAAAAAAPAAATAVVRPANGTSPLSLSANVSSPTEPVAVTAELELPSPIANGARPSPTAKRIEQSRSLHSPSAAGAALGGSDAEVPSPSLLLAGAKRNGSAAAAAAKGSGKPLVTEVVESAAAAPATNGRSPLRPQPIAVDSSAAASLAAASKAAAKIVSPAAAAAPIVVPDLPLPAVTATLNPVLFELD